jgi:hypothetical protein
VAGARADHRAAPGGRSTGIARWLRLAARLGGLLLALSAVEGGLAALVATASSGRAAELLAADPVRAGVVFRVLYSTLLGFIAVAHRARRTGASPSMAVGAGMAMAVVALTVSMLPWIDLEGGCRVGTFFFFEARSC